MSNQQVDAGTPVYDADGRWIGLVSLRHTPGPHLTIQQGRLFPRDIALPASLVAHADDAGISLRVSRDELTQ